ncbi:MAG: Wzz/FepE/Etk N-terminal domain-containing protein [Alphaproteobacteria bacterium]
MSEQGRVVVNDARDGELDLGAVGRALMRKKWWVLGPALAVAALTFVGVNLVTPKFKSEARALIEGRENVFMRPVAEQNSMERDRTVDQEAVTSQVQLALSRDLARQVIKQLKLGELPEFDSTLRGVSLIRYSLGFLGLAKDPLSMTPEERVLESYYDRLSVFQVDKSRVIAIEFQSADPDLAAKVANTVAENYLAFQQVARQEQTRAAGRWLGGEIDVLRKRVAEAEAKVEEFRAKTNLFIGPNGTTLSSQTLGESNRDLAAARSQKADLEAKAKFIRDVLKRGAAVEYSDMINSELIRRLNEQRVTLRAQLAEQSSTLLDGHPRIKELKAQITDLDRQIRDEAARLARSFDNDARIAGARLESLQNSLDQLKQQAASTNGQDVELRALEREAKAQRDLLESYLAKYRETTARDSLSAPGDARIISRALVSNTPYFPKKLPIVLVATLAALFIAAGFITTGELLAGNVYRAGTLVESAAEPVVRAAPVVGGAPVATAAEETAPKRSWLPRGFIRAKAAPAPDKTGPVVTRPVAPATASDEPAKEVTVDDLAAALREAGEGGKRVAVISAAPGNGATLTAVALARTLAKSSRVVMVDLALENPELASITLDPRAPGIADLVHGAASFGQIITRDRISRVQVVPAGRVGGDAAMVFMSERLSMAMDALSRAYDHVVIDAGAAPYVPADRIAKLASCGVLVAGDAKQDAVNAMRDQLANAGFSDIAVFTGTAPALDAESLGNVAA